MTASDPVELERFWLTFDLPPAPSHDGVVVDGDVPLGRALRSGIGVSARDVDDALKLVAAWLIEWHVIASVAEMPPVSHATVGIDVASVTIERLGNPAWRGIWSPADNLGGPTPHGSNRR